MDHHTSRRDLLLTSLMAALPLGISGAAASPLNPEQTIIKPPDDVAMANLAALSAGQRRQRRARRANHRARPLLHAGALASGIF